MRDAGLIDRDGILYSDYVSLPKNKYVDVVDYPGDTRSRVYEESFIGKISS
uniref:Uncharacterized protein n=1 Tax=viral metagenome TaxID=1070528 RepID=A0A6C0JT66_9ZZZZ